MVEVRKFIHKKTNEELLLHEDKVMSNLNNTQYRTWYLDTRASNHITYCVRKFPEIDTVIKGLVEFGNGIGMEIHGRGSFLLKCFTSKHCIVLINVYYVLLLRSNLIRLSQLDEKGCKIVVDEGVMSIMYKMHRLLDSPSKQIKILIICAIHHFESP